MVIDGVSFCFCWGVGSRRVLFSFIPFSLVPFSHSFAVFRGSLYVFRWGLKVRDLWSASGGGGPESMYF